MFVWMGILQLYLDILQVLIIICGITIGACLCLIPAMLFRTENPKYLGIYWSIILTVSIVLTICLQCIPYTLFNHVPLCAHNMCARSLPIIYEVFTIIALLLNFRHVENANICA
jgi:hypothetical protein